MQRLLAEWMDEAVFRWTVRRAQLRRRTLWPDPGLLQALRDGDPPRLDLDDPGLPSSVHLTPLHRGPTGPDCAFRFDSTPPFGQDHDRTVHGSLFLPRGEIRAATVVFPGAFVGLNGGMERHFYHRVAATFAERGIAAALIQPPLHQQRAPAGELSGHNLLHGDIFTYARAMAQAVRDVRATLGWLAAGYGRAGYWGISLGAMVGRMLAPHDPRLAFLVLVQPPNERRTAFRSSLTRVWSEQLAQSGVTDEDIDRALTLLRAEGPPTCGAERVLLQAARWDRVAAPAGVEQLWRRWGQPTLLWYDHSHTSIFLARDRLIADALAFVDSALAAPQAAAS